MFHLSSMVTTFLIWTRSWIQLHEINVFCRVTVQTYCLLAAERNNIRFMVFLGETTDSLSSQRRKQHLKRLSCFENSVQHRSVCYIRKQKIQFRFSIYSSALINSGKNTESLTESVVTHWRKKSRIIHWQHICFLINRISHSRTDSMKMMIELCIYSSCVLPGLEDGLQI